MHITTMELHNLTTTKPFRAKYTPQLQNVKSSHKIISRFQMGDNIFVTKTFSHRHMLYLETEDKSAVPVESL